MGCAILYGKANNLSAIVDFNRGPNHPLRWSNFHVQIMHALLVMDKGMPAGICGIRETDGLAMVVDGHRPALGPTQCSQISYHSVLPEAGMDFARRIRGKSRHLPQVIDAGGAGNFPAESPQVSHPATFTAKRVASPKESGFADDLSQVVDVGGVAPIPAQGAKVD